MHGVMEGQTDANFRAILNNSFIVAPDGMPTVWVGRAQGHSGMARVYGPDFMLRIRATDSISAALTPPESSSKKADC